jgi:hypothetical protein
MLKCLECGKLFVRPLSHVWQVHKLSAREYKELHGLDVKKGIATDEYKERMRHHALTNGTADNLKRVGIASRFVEGQSRNYKRSEQTMTRLKAHWLKVSNLNGRKPVIKIKINCALCGKEKHIYPRSFKQNNNYCGVICRNRQINNLNK